MIFEVSDIVRDARVALDLNRVDDALEGLHDLETLSLDEIILSKIEDAARFVESRAPAYLLDSGRTLDQSIVYDLKVGIGRGRMKLPPDFMRLISFKMSDWKRAVVNPILESDPRYLLQSSDFPGLRGNPERPVVAIINEPSGLTLEFWSCKDGQNVRLQRGRYLPFPRISEGRIELCQKLYRPIVLQSASLAAFAISEVERGRALSDMAESLYSPQ